jgi:hypothetical protein
VDLGLPMKLSFYGPPKAPLFLFDGTADYGLLALIFENFKYRKMYLNYKFLNYI